MKNICFQMNRKAWLAIAMALFMFIPALAQKVTVTGTVIDPDGEPAIGASVSVQGHAGTGAATDLDGKFTISVPSAKATLVVSYVGAQTQTVALEGRTNITVTLQSDKQVLDELVVIGYGTVKKEDATGSVAVIKPDEIEAGIATSVQNMLVGQTPGVVVTTQGGPEANATIRVRGGSSLNASNDPLIVVDGVPLDNGSVYGMGNALGMISPESIESMTVLKDASATAIYGSRASNGVIIITTKKGSAGTPKVNFTANVYVNTVAKTWDVMNGHEFADFVIANCSEASQGRLYYAGKNYNTDWQKEVTRTTLSSDYSLSVAGTTHNMPYRFDASYTNSNGIVKGSAMDRATLGMSLAPKLFDDHLSINANLHGYYIHNRFTEGGAAMGAAMAMDPTKPVYNNYPISGGNSGQQYMFGGLFTWINTASDGTVSVEQNAQRNPMSYVSCFDNHADVLRSNGNIQFDYAFHFLPELHANLNLGYDVTNAREWNITEENTPNTYWSHRKDGAGYETYRKQYKANTLLDFYLNYRKEVESIYSNFDVTAGYSWQRFSKRENQLGASSDAGRPTTVGFYSPKFDFENSTYSMDYNPETAAAIGKNFADDLVDPNGNYHYAERLQLLSFFGRFNYTFKDRYLLTATVRGDATSRFSKDNRWGVFPSVALGWRISQESFWKASWWNEFKLRLGWGKTGQQDVGSTCNYLPMYSIAGPGSFYPVVNNNGEIVYLPGYFLQGQNYNPDLKWETTTTYNVGFDFGFLNNRITAGLDAYYRKTTDLLSNVTIPAGSSTVNMMNRNIGDLENYGVEFNISARPIVSKDFNWTINYNVGYNHNEITALSDANETITHGGISGGTGNTVQGYHVGYPAGAFYLLQQVYDKSGNPIEGVFVDQNNDGKINSDDKVLSHSSDPKVVMTMSNNFTWKNWDLGFTLRASIGNYVYDNVKASNSAISSVDTYGLSNLIKTNFYFQDKSNANYYMSDYFLENASFLRCDNITLGYTWENLLANKLRLRVYGAVQNPFVITKYDGVDPEVQGGIDNNVYPRSRTYSVGLVATF